MVRELQIYLEVGHYTVMVYFLDSPKRKRVEDNSILAMVKSFCWRRNAGPMYTDVGRDALDFLAKYSKYI